jgi:hypothetical protein
MPADVLDAEQQSAFYALAHKHNLPQSVAKELLDFEVARAVETRKKIADEQNAQAKILADKMVVKYGEAAQSKLDAAAKFAEQFGNESLRKRVFDKDHPDPLGNDADVLELLVNAGALVTERGLMPGGTGAAAEGEVDYSKVYPSSFARGYMKK